ncbi:MAG: hypothetical protein KC620_15285 [Myxococcales bacterium]|nr:hypothetical protein [Myxococcales bacterium]
MSAWKRLFALGSGAARRAMQRDDEGEDAAVEAELADAEEGLPSRTRVRSQAAVTRRAAATAEAPPEPKSEAAPTVQQTERGGSRRSL